MPNSRRFVLTALLPLLAAYIYARYHLHRRSSSNSRTMPADVITLTTSMVLIPSPTGREQSVFRFAQDWLSHQNVTVLTQNVPPLISPTHPGRSNLLAIHPQANPSNVRVILSTHLDTVPQYIPSNIKTMANGEKRLYGRGSVDAKGQAAAMMIAFSRMRNPYIALLLVSGEESDHAGMIASHEFGFGPVSIINGEPTESKIATTQKGMIRTKILVSGKAAHSGYPHLGDSAIHKLIHLLHDLNTYPWEDGITVNVGYIHGGTAANVVADVAEAEVMWRIMKDTTTVLQAAEAITEKYDGAQLHVIRRNNGMDLFVPQIATEVGTTQVAYNTDLPYYQGQTVQLVLFGAGSIHQAHKSDEYIEIEQLRNLPRLYERIAKELLENWGTSDL